MSTTIEPSPPSPLPSHPTRPASTPFIRELTDVVGPPTYRPSLFKKRRRVFALLALGAAAVILLGWAAARWLFSPNQVQVEITATVVRAELPIVVSERGELESAKTIEVRNEIEGERSKIVEIIPEGTRVTKDQIVVRFDADELTRKKAEQEVKVKQAEGKAKAAKEELEVQKNKADSEVAKAELDLILARLDKEKYLEGEYQVEVDDKKGAIALAEKELQEAQEKLEQYRKFVKKGFGVPEQLRAKEADLQRAQFMLSRDKAKLDVLQKFTRKRQEEELTAKDKEATRQVERAKRSGNAAIAKAQSELNAADVTLTLEQRQFDRLEKQLQRCVVKAPQDGILVYYKRYYDEESRIRPGGICFYQQPLFTLPDLNQMQVKVRIHESVIKKVKLGHKTEIRIDAYPDRVLHGTVERVGTLADAERYWDQGTKEYVTIVKIDDLPPDAELKPGMTGEVKILVRRLADVLVVPVQSVTEKEGQHYSYVLASDGVEKRPVSVGENNDRFVEITSGLAEGDEVVLDARARIIAETEKVEPEVAKAPAPKPAKVPSTALSRSGSS